MADSTQPDLGQLQHAATWAATFGPGETNLARRNAKAGVVEDYNQALQNAHQQQVMQQIQTGKNAFNFWAKTAEMAQKERMHAADMAVAAPLKQAQLAAAEAAAEAHRVTALHTAASEARAAKQAADVANAQERFDSARHDAWTAFGPGSEQPDMGRYHQAVMEADMATPAAPTAFKAKHVTDAQKFLSEQPKQDDTAGFNQHMAELISRGVKPQSDEWQSGLAVGLSTFPKANPTVVGKYGPSSMPNPETLALKEQAQATREAQIASTATRREESDLNKEIARIEKEAPEWMGTTGIAPDKNGVERFGFADSKKSFEQSPAATPESKAQYQHYQSLLAKRAESSGPKKWQRVDGKLVPVE